MTRGYFQNQGHKNMTEQDEKVCILEGMATPNWILDLFNVYKNLSAQSLWAKLD